MKNISPLPAGLRQQINYLRQNHPELFETQIAPNLPCANFGLSDSSLKAVKDFLALEARKRIDESVLERKIPEQIFYPLQIAYAKSLVTCRLCTHLNEDRAPGAYRILTSLELQIPELASSFIELFDREGVYDNDKQRDYDNYESVTARLMIHKLDWVIDPIRSDQSKRLALDPDKLTAHENDILGQLIQRIFDFFLFFQSYIKIKHPGSKEILPACEGILRQLQLLQGCCVERMLEDCLSGLSYKQIYATYHRRLRKDYLFAGIQGVFDVNPHGALIEKHLGFSLEAA